MWCSGNTSVSKTEDEGSIPSTCAILNTVKEIPMTANKIASLSDSDLKLMESILYNSFRDHTNMHILRQITALINAVKDQRDLNEKLSIKW